MMLSPAQEHLLVLPVAPAYLHITASQFESLSCTEVRESHTGCVHLSSGVCTVGCLCNHRPPISMETAAGGRGQLLCLQCQLVSVGLAL